MIYVFFFIYTQKIWAFNEFTKAGSIISRAASLACGIEETLEGLSANDRTAIIRIPSINTEHTLIPGLFDLCVMIRSNNILMFSVIPSPGTGRKHKTIYYRDFPQSAFNTSGNMLEFTCSVRGVNFQHFSSFIPDNLPVPEKGEDIFR